MTPSSSRARSHRPALALLSLSTAAALVVAPAAAWAAPTVSGPSDPIDYTEQGAPVLIGEDVSVTGGTAFGNGYIDYAVTDADSSETLSLVTASSASTANGVTTIVGSTVYVGNGSTADVIGSVDPVRNGSDGVLRINFTSPFVNPSFEDGGVGGWTLLNQRIDLGVTQIAGFTTVDNSTYAGLQGNPGNDNTAPTSSATYTARISTSDASDGDFSLELSSSMSQTAEGYDVVHGPAVYSSPFEASSGDKIYFDWRAYYSGDNFHVFGYILNTVTGAQTTVLDASGDNSASPSFQTKETTIPASGTYRFVFVGGTHDYSGGQVAGARLLIDNVRVFGTKVNNAVVSSLSDKLQYANSSDDPPATRTVVITAADNGGTTTGSTTATINITPVDDAPTFGAVSGITLTNTPADDAFPAVTGVLDGDDPDSPLSYAIIGGAADAVTLGGTAYTHSLAGAYGTLHLNASTGAYRYVPDADAVNARQTDDEESFEFELTAPDQTPGSTAAPSTLRQTLTVDVSVPATAPSAPTAASAVAGNESAVVSWTAPTWTSGSPVTGYVVEQSTDGGETWTVAIDDTGSTATTATVTGLTGGEPVRFRASAINANGTGDPSAASDDVTPYSVAGAPGAPTVDPADRRVTLNWTAPDEDGNAPVTGYRIEQSTDGGATWTVAVADTGSTATTRSVSDLANGVEVTFRISALNAAGVGPASDTGAATPRTAPDAVRDLAATPADGAVELTWNEPADDGGAPVTGYRVEHSVDGGTTWTTIAADTASTGTSHTVSGLTNGEAGVFRVTAINAAGGGAPATVTATPRTVPGPVTVRTVTEGNRTLVVEFDEPTDDGGAPITGYEYSLDGGTTWLRAAGTTSPLRIEGLRNGTEYDVQVRAVNEAGPSDGSGTTSATPVLEPVVRLGDGTPIGEPATGDGAAYAGGVAQQTTVSRDGNTWILTGPGYTLRIEALDDEGTVLGLRDGAAAAAPSGTFRVTGEGLLPGSLVDLWLFDSDALLGVGTVADDGTFSVVVSVPVGTEIGAHTIQVNAQNADGVLVSAVAGVFVVAEPTAEEELASSGGTTAGVVGGSVAGALLIAGGAFALVTRRRRMVDAD